MKGLKIFITNWFLKNKKRRLETEGEELSQKVLNIITVMIITFLLLLFYVAKIHIKPT